MRKKEKKPDKNEIFVKVVADQPASFYFDKCTDLLLQYPMRKKDPDFALEWVVTVAQWRMATVGLKQIDLSFNKKVKGGGARDDKIDININNLKKCKKPAVFAYLTDTILHEVEHINIDHLNKSLKKDADGNVVHPFHTFVPQHLSGPITLTIKKACDMDVYTAGDYALGMYYINPGEVRARQAGLDNTLILFNAVRGFSTELDQLVDEMIHHEQKKFRTTPYDFVDYIDKYKSLKRIIHKDIYLLQDSYVQANCPQEDLVLFETAREIEPNQDAAHGAFAYYINSDQQQKAIDLLNSPTFKNNPLELQAAVSMLIQQGQSPAQTLTSFEQETLQPFIDQHTTLATQTAQPNTQSIEYVAVLPTNNTILSQ